MEVIMDKKKEYVVPQVVSYCEEEILTELGDVQLDASPIR